MFTLKNPVSPETLTTLLFRVGFEIESQQTPLSMIDDTALDLTTPVMVAVLRSEYSKADITSILSITGAGTFRQVDRDTHERIKKKIKARVHDDFMI
jgi:hypothetical protein